MATTSVTPDQDTVIAEIQIAAPPERVFSAISDARQLERWFSNPECPAKLWEMDARAGGSYRYEKQAGSADVNGVRDFKCHGEILEYDPPRLLVYTWKGNWHDTPNSSTVVRWELTPTNNGTQVRVTHSGLSNLPVARKGYAGGWLGVVQSLKNFVEAKN